MALMSAAKQLGATSFKYSLKMKGLDVFGGLNLIA